MEEGRRGDALYLFSYVFLHSRLVSYSNVPFQPHLISARSLSAQSERRVERSRQEEDRRQQEDRIARMLEG